jgi:hypothetical protein
MDTQYDFEVKLWEDEIERDEAGKITHHPLNSRYFVTLGEDIPSYGHLTFCGHDMDKSPLFDDVRVFYLQFFGRPDEHDREAWADPLRVEVLQRLTGNNRCWYLSLRDLSIKGAGFGEDVTKILGMKLNQIEVESEKPFGYGYGFKSRQFFEVPNHQLNKAILYFWPEAIPADPIEGYNMESGQMETIREWNLRPRDDRLFREVIDRTFVNFYSFPAEHRHFVFVTNKLDYDNLARLIGLEELQERAIEIGREKQ